MPDAVRRNIVRRIMLPTNDFLVFLNVVDVGLFGGDYLCFVP